MTKESQNIEFKQSWHDDCLKWICGFANAQGGRIFIGKDDSGNVTGLAKAKKLLEDLPNKIRDQLGLMPHINLLEEDGKAYLEIIVEASTVPISLRGSYYWRSGSVKQELKGHALTDFLLKKMGMTWDQVIQERATLDDIDDATIALFKKEAATAGRLPDISGLSAQELLKKLHLFTEKGLTNAALVLFGKDPGKFYPNTFVKIGRFGLNMVDIRFQEVCEGNLFQLLRGVMDDRISLWNAGLLPLELSVEKLFQTHKSIPRNPLIAEVCYRGGYIDSWGRGIEKITDACKAAGLPEPVIEENSGGVVVELVKASASEKTTSENNGADFGTISERIRKEFGSEPAKAFEIIRQHPEFTAEQIAEQLVKTPRTIENYIAKLKKAGFIIRRGPKLGGYWEVKE